MTGTDHEHMSWRTFRNRSLHGSRFIGCDFSGVVIRGSDVEGMEIDSPWLLEAAAPLLVNGVDVLPYVDAELDRRFPGRRLRSASDPDGLAAAWQALELTWRATLQRALAMPAGTLEASVDDEWSFVQTLRHLVMATDTWLGGAILGLDRPYHRAGLPNAGQSPAYEESDFDADPPALELILQVRADRQGMVRRFIAEVTPDVLAEPRRNPHAPDVEETVGSCLRTILEEEWEHHRYAVRDLAVLAAATHAGAVPVTPPVAP